MCAEIAGTTVVFDLPDEIEEKGFSRSKIAFWIIQNCENLDGMENLRLEMGLQKHWRI